MKPQKVDELSEKAEVATETGTETEQNVRSAIEAELAEIGQRISGLQQASNNYGLTFAPGSNSARQMFNSMSTGALVGKLRAKELELQARISQLTEK